MKELLAEWLGIEDLRERIQSLEYIVGSYEKARQDHQAAILSLRADNTKMRKRLKALEDRTPVVEQRMITIREDN